LTALPHLQQRDERPLGELLAAMHDCRCSDECYLAVSKGFWDPNEQDAFNEIFNEYMQFFADIVIQATQLFGQPDFQGRWDSPEFPEWAIGLEAAIWSNGFWLRIEHEDRECPIIIALSAIPA
jgi:hypothetical protein